MLHADDGPERSGPSPFAAGVAAAATDIDRTTPAGRTSGSNVKQGRTTMAWLYLVFAGLLEIVWAVGLKYSEGFSKPLPSVVTGVALVASFWLLALALKQIPLGTGYAVWVGIGAVGAAVLGMVLFDESVSLARIGCMVLIVAGIAGLKLTSTA